MPKVRSDAQVGLNDNRFTFAAPSKWLKEFREFARSDDRFNGNVSAAVKAGADLLMAGAAAKSNPNAVSFDLSEGDLEELRKLADDTLHLDDPNLFAKILTRKALDLGPDAVREILLGQAKREISANIEAKNEPRAKRTPSKTSAKIRDAA